MASLHEFIRKNIFIRLTEDGFISTVRYGHLCAKSATWNTRCLEVVDETLRLHWVTNVTTGDLPQQPAAKEFESDPEDQ